jgi:hypothetical protein
MWGGTPGSWMWTCAVCREERPDAVISVEKRVAVLEGGAQVGVNVKYCNDRQSCAQGAMALADSQLAVILEKWGKRP